jgi:hypothetical protein
MLKFPTTEILVFLVLHWVDWRAHGNNCDYYYVGQDEKISITPLSHSDVAIDMPDPSSPVPDSPPHCLWPSSRSNSYLMTDLNAIDTFSCKDSSQDSHRHKLHLNDAVVGDICKLDYCAPKFVTALPCLP